MKSSAALQARDATPDTATPVSDPATTARRPRPAPRGGRHFAEVPVAAGGDADAEALKALLDHLAGRLGIRTGSIVVRSGAEAQRVAADAGAAGAAHQGVIHIPQAHLAPRTAEGRRLIAHEAAHIAQMRRPAPARRSTLQAEVEAERFARRYVSTGAAEPVRVALPAEARAAFNDGGDAIIAENHAQEIAAITDLMSYGALDWAITDQDVFDALQILASYPLFVARGICRGVARKYRERLLDNLNPAHFAAHRAEILAAASAADGEAEFKVIGYDLLARMALDDLDPVEAIALDRIAQAAPKLVTKAIEADARKAKRIGEVRAYVESGDALRDGEKTLHEGFEGEWKLKRDREAAEETRRRLAATDPAGEAAAKALGARIDNEDLTPAQAEGILRDIQKALPRQLDQTAEVEALTLRLGTPRISRLLEHIPPRMLYGDAGLRATFIQLAAARPPYLNAKLAEDLTTSPWWKVWDDVSTEEAYGAYLLVKALPTRARTAFLKSRAGARWGEILAVLPASVREDPAFNFYDGGKDGGRDQADRQGLLLLVSDDALWAAAAVEPAVDPPEEAAAAVGPSEKAPKPDPLDRLESLIRLAKAAGEGPFVFEQSKRLKAHQWPRLRPLVERHRLYVEGVRETYEPAVLPEDKSAGMSWFRLALGVAGSAIANFFTGKKGFEADISRLDEVGGARFRRTTDAEKDAAELNGTFGRNVLHIELGKNSVFIDGPSIVIEALATIGDTSIHAAPITVAGMRLHMQHEPGLTRFSIKQLKSLEVTFDEVVLNDLSIAFSDSIYSAKSLRIAGGRIRIGNETLDDKNADALWLWRALEVVLKPVGAKNAAVAFDLLTLRSLAGSSGFFIDSIEIEGFALETAGDPSAYVEALIKSVGRLKPRAEAEREAARYDPENAETHRAEAARIDRQIAKARAEIDKGEPHGAVVDIRKIRVSGLEGISDEPLEITDIHGQGRSVTAVAPLFMDPTSMRNLIRGQDQASTLRGPDSPSARRGRQSQAETFSVDIGRIQTKKPLRLAGAIPTADKARAEYEAFVSANSKARFDAHWVPVEQSLRDRRDQAARYEALARRGIQYLEAAEADELRRLRAALMAFEERRAMIVESLTLEGVTLDIKDDGNPEIAAEILKTGAIRTFGPDGAETFSIGGVEGRNVAIGASLKDGLANYKDWRKALQAGTLKADQLTLKDIRFAGLDAKIDELSFESAGDAKALDIAFQRGGADTGGAGVTVRSGKIIAKGLNAPTQMALLKAEEARILAIVPETERTAEEVKRLQAIGRMLRDYDRLSAAKAAAEAASGKAKTKPQRAAAAKALDAAERGLSDWQARLVVEKLTVDRLDIAISGLGDVLAEGYAFDKQATALAIRGGTEGQPWFQRAEVAGLSRRGDKGDQLIAERITIGPVGGEVRRTEKGYALKGVTIASVAAKGVAWQSGKTSIRSIGESRLEGISIDAEYVKDGGTTILKVTSAGIQRVVADQLRYEGESAVVTITSGALVGVSITGMTVTIPETGDMAIEGQAAVRQVQALALDAVVGGKKIVGQIDSKTPTAEANAVKAEFASSGERTLSLLGLNANAQVTDLKTGGRLHVALKNLSGTITQKNKDDFEVRDLSIPDVTVTGIHWIAGDWTIDVADRVTLAGIMLDADASLRDKPLKKGETPKLDDEGEPIVERELAKMLVRKLTVGEIAARKVKVTKDKVDADPGKGVKYKPQKTFELNEAVIRGLRVTGFDVLAKTGKIEVTQSVKVTDLKATIGSMATNDLKSGTASFSLYGQDAKEPGPKARELSATLTAKDGTTLKLGRTQDLVVRGLDVLSEDEKSKSLASWTSVEELTVPGISVGEVLVRDDLVEVLGIEIDAPVTIQNPDWYGSKGSKQVALDTATVTDTIKIAAITATFRATTEKDKTGKDVPSSELDRLTVAGILVPKVVGKGFVYDGPSGEDDEPGRVTVTIPEVTIEDIAIDEIDKDATANTLGLKGRVGKLAAPKLAATLAKSVGEKKDALTFGADLTATDLTADAVLRTTKDAAGEEHTALEKGGFRITSLGIKRLTGSSPNPADGSKPWTLGKSDKYPQKDDLSGEVKGINLDKNGVKIDSADLHGLAFKDPQHGISIDIQDISVPKGVTIPKTGPIVLPEGVIKNAAFRIDDLDALMPKSAGGDEEEGFLKKEQRDDLLDHINGTVTGKIFVPLWLWDAVGYGWYVRQDVFDLDLVFTNGKLDYERAWKKAAWLRYRAIASLQMDYDYEMGISGDVVPGPSYLTLQVGSFNQKEWTPGDEKERAEMEAGEVRLKRLIAPDGSDKKKEKKLDKDGNEVKERPMVDTDGIELQEVAADFTITGGTTLDLKEYGQIKLGAEGRNAISDLKVNGTDKNHVTWSIGSLAVEVNALNIKGNQITGAGGKPAVLLIDGVTGGEADFHNGKVAHPSRLEGTITSATVRNLALTRGETK